MSEKSKGFSRRRAIAAMAGVYVASSTINEERYLDAAQSSSGKPIFGLRPFTVPLPLPRTLSPLAIGAPPFTPGDVFHGIAPEFNNRRVAERPDLTWYEAFPTKWYEMRIRDTVQEIIPGVRTRLYGYDGTFPGPTIKTRVGQPVVIRFRNELNVETSVHLHGAHSPAHSDGYPNFYIQPGKARDYFYPVSVPMFNGKPDFSESPSTMWYHDHAMDRTAEHVWRGLCGFFIATDHIEQELIDRKVLPTEPYDIPLALQDRRFRRDGSLFYDPLDHNGTLGNVWVVNGKAQPFLQVQRRKYRFRILNGCNARFLELRLSNGQPFIGIAKDTWLFPSAVERNTLLLSMAQRADVIIDFTNAPNEVYLENILAQKDGRGPEGKLDDRETLDAPVPFLKFVVSDQPVRDDTTIKVGTTLRPHETISSSEITQTRVFEFMRRKGAWQINKQFFDPNIANATPTVGKAERWVLRNNGGGWWHPIHIHLESHQIETLNGKVPDVVDRFKNDTVILDGNGEAVILMRFRTFLGPFVFHCHNVEHEDMRMMFTFDPRLRPTKAPQTIQQSFP